MGCAMDNMRGSKFYMLSICRFRSLLLASNITVLCYETRKAKSTMRGSNLYVFHICTTIISSAISFNMLCTSLFKMTTITCLNHRFFVHLNHKAKFYTRYIFFSFLVSLRPSWGGNLCTPANSSISPFNSIKASEIWS